MKIIKFFLRFFVVLFIVSFIAATMYVRIYGKSLVERALNASLQRNVVLGEISYHFPFGFRARDVRIARSLQGGEFLEVGKAVARLSPTALYRGEFAFESVKLIDPSLVVEGGREEDDVSQGPTSNQETVVVPDAPDPSVTKSVPAPVKARDQGPKTKISIARLTVDHGRLRYKDGLTQKGFSFDLEDVQLKAKQLVFPLEPGRSHFNFSARLIKKGNPLSGSRVQGSGWVDAVSRDMEAWFEVIEENGTVGLTALAVSTDNDMDVTGEIKMRNLLRGVEQQDPPDTSSINDLVLNALSSSGVEIGAKFAFKTKMDRFRVGQISFTGNVVTK